MRRNNVQHPRDEQFSFARTSTCNLCSLGVTTAEEPVLALFWPSLNGHYDCTCPAG